MGIKIRLIEIIKYSGMKQTAIAEKSGIPYSRWRSVLHNDKTRVNEDIITAIDKLFPQFTYYLVTGNTLPDSGQTSPAEEEVKEAQKRLDQAIKKRNEKSG